MPKGKGQIDSHVQHRVDQIIEAIEDGTYVRRYIFRKVAKNYDKLSTRTFDNDLEKAWEQIREFIKPQRKDMIANAIMRLEGLFKKNMKIQDYREARQVQEAINKMLGLNEAQKIDHTSKGQQITGMTIK